MKPHDVYSDILGVLDLLNDHELTVLINTVVQEHTGGTLLVTFKSHLGYNFEIQRDFTTIAEYRRIVGSGCYSAMLYDGSILQASYTFRHSKLIKHRLAFYPCPFAFERNDLMEVGASELIELITADKGLDSVYLRSPMRFDYSPRDARAGHPASHLTLNWAHCRVGVSAPLSFGHFVRLIFRNFYPRIWAQHEWLRKTGVRRMNREIVPNEEEEAHFELGLGPDAGLLAES